MGDCTTGTDRCGGGGHVERSLSLFFDDRDGRWAVELSGGAFGELLGRRTFASMDEARDFYSCAVTDLHDADFGLEGGDAAWDPLT